MVFVYYSQDVPNIIEKELSYRVMGLLFDVSNELGNEYQEKYYQRAIEQAFIENNILYKKELSVDLFYHDKKVGKYVLDFLVQDKIILEIKTAPLFTKENIRQVLGYLQSTNKPLGILANFRTKQLTYKRIINSHYR